MVVPGLAGTPGTVGHGTEPHTSPSIPSLQQAGLHLKKPIRSSTREGAKQSRSPGRHSCGTMHLSSSLSHLGPPAADTAPARSATTLEADLVADLSGFSKPHQISPSGVQPHLCPVPAGQRHSGHCSPSGLHQGPHLHHHSPWTSVGSQGHQGTAPPTLLPSQGEENFPTPAGLGDTEGKMLSGQSRL